MTDAELDEIQARADAATEGPWEEEWRLIPGVDGYEVSDHGNVRSYFKKGQHREKRSPYPRTLARRVGKNRGYPSVSLPNATGSYSSRRIHRIVMEAFVGPCPCGMEVAHLNGDSNDARLANLAYVSHAENESHKLAHGTDGAGDRNSNALLLGWQVAEIQYLAGKGIPQGRIAALFEISHKQVSEVLSGRSWLSVGARQDIPALVAEVQRLRKASCDNKTRLRESLISASRE